MTSIKKISANIQADNFLKVCLLCIFMLFAFSNSYAQNDTVYVNKKVIITDTIYKKKADPEYKNDKKKQKPGRSYRRNSRIQKVSRPIDKQWFLGTSGTAMMSNNVYNPNTNSSNKVTDEFSSRLSPALSYSAYLNGGVKLNDWSIESGIGYSEFNQEFTYSELIESITTSIENYTVVTNEYYILDTINEFTIRVFKDGIWEEVTHYDVDSTFVSETEDRTREVDDTLRKTVNHNLLNKFRYIEIPFILAKEWKTNDFILSAKTGAIFGVLTRSSGRTIRLNSGSNRFFVDDLSSDPYNKISLSFLLAFGIEYKKDDDVSYFIEPFYRQSINDLLPSNYRYNMTHKAYGLRFGMRFYLN